jgi:hypothetical protein
MCTYSGLQTFCVCSLVFLLSQRLRVLDSRILLVPLILFGLWPPKCDAFHLVDPYSALSSSASVTRRYLVTLQHDIPLPSHSVISQRVTTSTQVGLRAACTLHVSNNMAQFFSLKKNICSN